MTARSFGLPIGAFALLTAAWVTGAASQNLSSNEPRSMSNVELVRAFVDAFNRKSIDEMLRMTSDDIVWLSVDGETIGVETRGQDALRHSMMEYFGKVQIVKSELTLIESLGPYVTTHERAVGSRQPGTPVPASVAVYEIRDSLIRRVWYYPAVTAP